MQISGLTQKWDNNDSNINCTYDDTQVGEDDVFMTLDLPLENSESKSNSEGTGSNRKFFTKNSKFDQILNFVLNLIESVEKQPSLNQQPLKKPGIQYISGEITSNNSNSDTNSMAPTTQQSMIPADYSYVQLTAVNEFGSYSLPEDPLTTSVLRRESTGSLKKHVAHEVSESIMKDSHQHVIRARLRCR